MCASEELSENRSRRHLLSNSQAARSTSRAERSLPTTTDRGIVILAEITTPRWATRSRRVPGPVPVSIPIGHGLRAIKRRPRRHVRRFVVVHVSGEAGTHDRDGGGPQEQALGTEQQAVDGGVNERRGGSEPGEDGRTGTLGESQPEFLRAELRELCLEHLGVPVRDTAPGKGRRILATRRGHVRCISCSKRSVAFSGHPAIMPRRRRGGPVFACFWCTGSEHLSMGSPSDRAARCFTPDA